MPGAERPGPAGDANIFAEMASSFSLDERVTKYLGETLKLESLHDFLYSVSREEDVAALVEKIGLSDTEAPLQTARLRRAWVSLREALTESARIRSTPEDSTADLDALLPTKDLAKARSAFWARYRFGFPAYAQPSDQMLSRVLREFNMRMLTVRPLEKVQTQLSQITQGAALKVKGGDVNAYLINLRTLMISFAIAGARPAVDKTQPTNETEHSDPTEWMECPLEVVMRYYLRAEQKAMEILAAKGPGPAFAWLRIRDQDDRAAWVETHRASGSSIGTAIANTLKTREATWLTDTEIRVTSQPPRPLPGGPAHQPAPRQQSNVQKHAERSRQSAPAAKAPNKMPDDFLGTLPNGSQVCWAWNREPNGCKEPCPHGRVHFCGFWVRKGRACGFKNHRYCEHRDVASTAHKKPRTGSKK